MKAQVKIAFGFGVAFVVALLCLAVVFPTPTVFQYNVFRIVLSLAAAGVAAMIPGFIELKLSTIAGLLIRAGGALAVFVIVFFFNPAQLAANPPLKQLAKLRIINIDVEKVSQTVRRLDIKLVNDGDSVAFTRELNIKVKRLAYALPGVEPSGEYDLEITNAERNALSISHKIAPDDAERIIVNVSFSRKYWCYVLDMTVEILYDENMKVVSGPIGVNVF